MMTGDMDKVLITVIFVLIALGVFALAGCQSVPSLKELECITRDQTSRPCGGW